MRIMYSATASWTATRDSRNTCGGETFKNFLETSTCDWLFEDIFGSDDADDKRLVNEVEIFSSVIGEHEIDCVQCGAHTLYLVLIGATREV